MKPEIHPQAIVLSQSIGGRSTIGPFSFVSLKASIGRECQLESHCFVGDGVEIGDRVNVGAGSRISGTVRIGDDVSLEAGSCVWAGVSESNITRSGSLEAIAIAEGARIGTGATLIGGVRVGRGALVKPGTLVERAVPPYAIVEGNPSRIVGYVDVEATPGSPTAESHLAPAATTAVRGITIINLPSNSDIRGNLVVGECEAIVPFPVRRYFVVYGVPSLETRGEHAHRECHQFLTCVKGSCAVVGDDGKARQEFVLDRPDVALHVQPMTWTTQYKHSSDAVLLVLTSHHYDPDDYIREYGAFKAIATGAT